MGKAFPLPIYAKCIYPSMSNGRVIYMQNKGFDPEI